MLVKNFKDRMAWKAFSIRNNLFDNFIFIHINKTGGSSVEKALKLPLEHKTAMEKIAEMGMDCWNKKISFVVVRNPWDKVVSHYHYRVRKNKSQMKDKPIEFKDWVQRAYRDRDPFYYHNPKMYMPQFNWIADEKGQLLVDHVCRFENLDQDFHFVCEKIGKQVQLPHIKCTNRSQYSDYYDNETINIVADCFKLDIDNFEYEFG